MTDFRSRVLDIALPELPPGFRNHLINLTYHEMALALESLVGSADATWPHFAKWTSFTVGFDLRVSDPPPPAGAAQDGIGRATNAVRRAPRKLGRAVGRVPVPDELRQRLTKLYLHTIKGVGGRLFGRSISLANRGVFFELGATVADFVETFWGFEEPTAADIAALDEVIARARLLPDPPGERWAAADRDLLARGLSAYFEAMCQPEGPARSQRVLYGTICLTEFEQQRLQTWLRLSLLSPHRMALDWVRRFLAWGVCLRPKDVGPPNRFEEMVARTVTRLFVAVRVPGEVVRASRNLRNPGGVDVFFPPELAVITDRELTEALLRYDGAALQRRDGAGTRVASWIDRPARMRFINTWFRSRQRVGALLAAPYSQEEVQELDAVAARVTEKRRPPEFDDVDPRPAPPTPPLSPHWTDAAMDRLRTVGDPEVDALLAGIFDGQPLDGDDVTAPLRTLLAQPPPSVADFRNRLGPRPGWIRPDRCAAGRAFYDRWRFQINMGLLFASLPGSYAAERGVQVLSIASQLTKDPRRRVTETARFLEDVMTTDPLRSGTDGFLEAKHVRLLHGLVRRMVRDRTVDVNALDERATPAVRHINRYWDPAWGVPANQEDTLGTLLAFAVKPLEFLEVVGAPFSGDEADAYVHAWCCVGLELGIPPELLESPADPARSLTFSEARQLMRVIEYRNLQPNWAGQWLAAALVEVLECMVVTKSLPRAFIRVGATPGVPEMLGIPRARLVELALVNLHGFFASTSGLRPVGRFYSWVAGRLGKRLRRRIDRDPRAGGAAFLTGTSRAPTPAPLPAQPEPTPLHPRG